VPDNVIDQILKPHATVYQQQLNQGLYPQERKKPPKWAKYTHWPNPFANAIKSIDVLACEDNWLAMVEFWGIGIGSFLWKNFIPSPVELTRKGITGSYKCGFYMFGDLPSPLDIIWRDKSASRALIGITRPIAEGLFYWWAAETAYAALATWDSLMIAGEFCDLDGNECVLRNGKGPVVGGEGDFNGEPALYSELYDPQNRYPELGSHIEIYDASNVGVFACGQVLTGPRTLTNVVVGIKQEGDWVAEVPLGTLGPETVTDWSTSFATGLSGSSFFSVGIRGHKEELAVLPAEFNVTRFLVKVSDKTIDWPNYNHFPFKEPLHLSCWQKYYQDLVEV